MGLTALSNSAYAIIAPFLPFEFERKGISNDWIGYIFAIYSLAVILCSPGVSSLIKVVGRRNLIGLGLFLMGSSFVIFALTSHIEDRRLLVTLSLLNRFLQGFSSTLIQTTLYSVCTNFYPDDKETMVGLIEAFTGVGNIIGPFIGSVLYSVGGYKFIFYAMGSVFILCSSTVRWMLPRDVDVRESSPSKAQDDDYLPFPTDSQNLIVEPQPTGTVKGMDLLKNGRFFLAACSGSLGYFLYGFMEPILAFRVKDFSLSQFQIGIFFTIMPITYIPTCVLIQKVPSGVDKRALMIMASFILFSINLILGPSKIFEFPDSLWFVTCGLALRGILDPFTLIPSLPEMIESALLLYPEDLEPEINDVSSGIFNMFLGIG